MSRIPFSLSPCPFSLSTFFFKKKPTSSHSGSIETRYIGRFYPSEIRQAISSEEVIVNQCASASVQKAFAGRPYCYYSLTYSFERFTAFHALCSIAKSSSMCNLLLPAQQFPTARSQRHPLTYLSTKLRILESDNHDDSDIDFSFATSKCFFQLDRSELGV